MADPTPSQQLKDAADAVTLARTNLAAAVQAARATNTARADAQTALDNALTKFQECSAKFTQ